VRCPAPAAQAYSHSHIRIQPASSLLEKYDHTFGVFMRRRWVGRPGKELSKRNRVISLVKITVMGKLSIYFFRPQRKWG
jgi:hypothetical protein